MRSYLRAFVITALVGIAFVWGFSKWREKASFSEGAQKISAIDEMEASGVPGFEAKDLEGKDVLLAAFKGKITLINFWASWCGPCLEEFPSMISLIEKFGGSVQLIAISGDNSREDIDAFLKAFPKAKNPSIHLVWDEDRSITKKYSVDRLPETFIANKDLKLVKKVVGTINWHTPDSEAFMKEILSK